MTDIDRLFESVLFLRTTHRHYHRQQQQQHHGNDNTKKSGIKWRREREREKSA